MPLKVEVGSGWAVATVQPELHSTKFDVATITVELDMARAEHVDVAGVPAFDLDDPPPAEHSGATRLRHAAFSSNFGRRTRLHAAAVRVTTQPTRGKPRWRVLRNPATT